MCKQLLEKWWACGEAVTLTPLSLRSGVRVGVMGALLLEGNMLGAVGLRNGALGIPFSGADVEVEEH